MGCLAEMTVAHPTPGSFGAWAEFYMSPIAGFLVRFCYWAGVVLALGTEVTAIAVYMRFWFPVVPGWIWICSFSIALVAVNAFNVGVFGAVEYAFSALKVVAICAFIVLGTLGGSSSFSWLCCGPGSSHRLPQLHRLWWLFSKRCLGHVGLRPGIAVQLFFDRDDCRSCRGSERPAPRHHTRLSRHNCSPGGFLCTHPGVDSRHRAMDDNRCRYLTVTVCDRHHALSYSGSRCGRELCDPRRRAFRHEQSALYHRPHAV